MKPKSYSMELGGRTLTLEFGKYAQQAAGSVLVRYGDNAILAAVTVSETPRPGIDFFPLGCDFEEKMYSVGKIPGGFIKREGRPSEKAILTSRLIDRPLRPLFPKGFRNDVNVVCEVLSSDDDATPEIPAMIGSSVALCVSEIPFAGPTGSVLIGMDEQGGFIVNPDAAQRKASPLHLVVSGTRDAVMMVEAGAKEVSEDTMLAAILFAHEEIKKIVAFQDAIVAEIGKEKRVFDYVLVPEDIAADVRAFAYDRVVWSFSTTEREERQEREDVVKKETLEHFAPKYPDGAGFIGDALYSLNKEVMRKNIIENGVRPDGRNTRQVRPIWCEVGLLPRPHGSAVFTRGQTQVVNIVTLGLLSEAQMLDNIYPETTKRYMHHYNFPPFSTGEARPLRSPGRREIGHGALAERALEPMIPDEVTFPYALRLVSEAISSNGSTSMASVCGSTLSLMDAGVPIKAPVAGVAMGLIKESDKVAVLTDIQGLEDFLGDMDFKVAGTKDGITAIQMDIKIKGIDEPILKQALAQAYEGRMHILGEMLKTLPESRAELSPRAPRIITFTIHPDKIREVIGTGGKVINKIIADTGVKIDIEDDGRVFIASNDAESGEKARKIIDGIVRDIQVGDVYTGKVVRIMSFGAFVELTSGKDGMIHISRLSAERVEKVEDVVNIGDEMTVKVIEIDPQGRVNLARADIDIPERPRPPRPDRPPMGDRRGGFNRDRGPRRD